MREIIYVSGTDQNHPQQVYIPEFAKTDGALSLENRNGRIKIDLNPGYKFFVSYSNGNTELLDFYDYNMKLNRNPFSNEYNISDNNNSFSFNNVPS